ncbi:MucBP domain-containing protein [Lacticaseibacillus sp. GG6-2]
MSLFYLTNLLHLNCKSVTFKETIVSGQPVNFKVDATPVTNYVGPTDVGTYNVMNSSWLTMDVTKSTKDPVNITFKVPANMIGTGLKISSQYAAGALYGLTATLTAYDANGTVLASGNLGSLAKDSSSIYTWMPDVNASIASFGVDFTSLPNTSYSQIKLAPILAVATAPNGSQTYTIPTSSEIGGTTVPYTNYQVIVTDSHAIMSANPHLDGTTPAGPYQAGEALKAEDGDAAFGFYPFDKWSLTTYNILDQPAVFLLPLPDHATFVKTDKFNENTSEVMLNGHRYLRIDVPAGYSVNSSVNNKYNTSVQINHIQVEMNANADVTPDTQIKMGNAIQEPSFIGIKDDNIDANFWTASGGRIWTFDQLRQNGFGDVATLLQNAGYTRAYLDTVDRSSQQYSGTLFPITAPTELMLSTGVKADAEDTYVSGTDGTASFYPGGLTGSIREYIYNGGANTSLDYHGLVTLPKTADWDAYSLDLTGAITVPAGVTVQYSTQKVTGTDGQALSATQLASFTDGSSISDWGSVKSILFTAPTLANKASVDVEFPVKVTDVPTAAATAKALVFNYTKADGGTILGAKTTDLNTRVAEAQRVITVKYQDSDGNTLAADRTMKADAGSVLTLTAMTITGYTPQQASQAYTITEDPNQTVIFIYNRAQMSVTVNFINVLTNTNAKGQQTLKGYIGDSLDLTADTYTKIAGYTAMPDNAKAYTVTTSQIQNINLYFTPQTMPFTVNFVADADHSKVLAPAQTFGNGIMGYQYPVTAATVVGYTPTKNSDNLTLSTTQNSYTFYYKANPQTLTIHYVDESGNSLHPNTTAATTTNAAYDLTSTVDNVAIAGYERETPDADLKGTATLGADGKLVKSEVTVTYRVAKKTITIHFVDDKDNKLHDDTTATTATNAVYDLKSTVDGVTIPGYTRQTTDDALKGTAKIDANGDLLVPAVTVVYTADDQNLTIHYVDLNGNKLHDDSNVPTKTDAAYDLKTTVEGVDIPGYTRQTTDEELKGTAKLNSDGKVPDVTVVYTADAQNLTVHYVDDKGNKLHDDSNVPTKTDAAYDLKTTVEGVDIPGYTRQTTDEELKGTAKLNSDGKVPDVTVVYTADAQNLTIHYVDDKGNSLHSDSNFTTATNAEYDLKPTVDGVTISGYYQRQTTDDELKGTATVDAEGKLLVSEVTVKYKALTKTIHVHYVNNLSREDLAPSTEITKNLGELYSAEYHEISGYRLVPNTLSGLNDYMTEDTKDVFFVYQPMMQVPNETAVKTVLTMHYVDGAGNKIADPTTQTGKVGDDFSVSAPEIQNYHPKDYTPVSGTYQGNAMDLTFVYDKDGQVVDDAATPAKLTVHYTNVVTGEPVQPDKVTTGDQGTAFTETAPALDGYTVVGPATVDGKYAGSAMDLTFNYQPLDESSATTLTVHYVNAETGATLQPDKVTSGSQGADFTETAPALDGYTVVGSATVDGKYAGSAMDLTFNYQPLDESSATTLTVYYVNAETGATLQPDRVTSGIAGADFTETAPALDGYTIVGPATVDGKYAGSAMDLTFNYQPLDENSATMLTVHYVNAETGATLQPDKVTSGSQGADFTETAPALDGYTVVGPATVDGEYAGSAMDLTFNYQPLDENSATTLTVHYVNAETGATLQPDKVTSGIAGAEFTETAPALDGYTVVGPATVDGKYAGSAMDLTFNYQPLDENSATTLTVHYVNAETGATLQADKVTSGSQGAEFTETAPALDGYTVVGSATVDGKYAGSAMDLTFNYQPLDENSATTLTVHYVNAETGATLQPDKVTSGSQGAEFTETAPALDGYTVVGPATVDGKYAGSAMDLTFNLDYS